MKKVYVFLADGFEEIEALTVVDLLRRAEVQVVTVSVSEHLLVHGGHDIDVMADQLFKDGSFSDGDMLVLPGGKLGTEGLRKHEGLRVLVEEYDTKNRWVAAICAAPSILGGLGMLKGRQAVSHPSVEDKLEGAKVLHVPVVRDGHIVTSRGLGTANDFALELISVLADRHLAEQIAESIVYGGWEEPS